MSWGSIPMRKGVRYSTPMRWRVRYWHGKVLVDDLLVIAPNKESALIRAAEYRHQHYTNMRKQVPFADKVVAARLPKSTERRLKALLMRLGTWPVGDTGKD